MKKLGFTLIELLAVILILGIIALIAIPTINNIIKESKKGAFKSSTQNIISSVEQKCRMEQLKGEDITKYYRFENGVSLTDAGFKGEVPTDGSVVVDDECNIDIVVNKENYIAIKSKEADEVTIIEDTYYKPGTPVVYRPSQEAPKNWYVVKDNGETVTLLLDTIYYSTNRVIPFSWMEDYQEAGGIGSYKEKVGWNDLGAVSVIKNLETIVSLWRDEAKETARLLNYEEVFEILGINISKEQLVPGFKLYFDTKSSEVPNLNGQTSRYHWLFATLSGCTEYGCKNGGITGEEGIYSMSYWLDGYVSKGITAFNISFDGTIGLNEYYQDDTDGHMHAAIKPVITIPKSSLIDN